MSIITEVGHQLIKIGSREWVFNPSFNAINRLGSPKEIVTMFSDVFGSHYPQFMPDNETIKRIINSQTYGRSVLSSAAAIIQACCKSDCDELTGYFKFNKKNKLTYRVGLLPIDDLIVLARALAVDGISGRNINASKTERDYSSEFNVRDFVYMAVAQLGMSERDAWNMTMTGFQFAMAAKFPREESFIPSQEEYDEIFAISKS